MDWTRIESALLRIGAEESDVRALSWSMRSAVTRAGAGTIAAALAGQRGFDRIWSRRALDMVAQVLLELTKEDPDGDTGEFLRALELVAPRATAPSAHAWLEPLGAHADLAREYFELVSGSNQRAAERLILDALDDGLDVRDLYLQVFQPCLREVGRLWQEGALPVGEEHYFAAVTQSLMVMLHHRVFAVEPTREVLLAASVEGNIHELGIRMVADFFELDGWDTHYLGASVSNEKVVDTVRSIRPRILAVSIALRSQIAQLTSLVAQLRDGRDLADLKILVGGHGLLGLPEEQRTAGADAFAVDARAALRVASELVGA